MNKKGFTLVELLAVIVILGLITGISIVAIFTSIGNAKKKAEREFLTQLSNSVEAYIDLCKSDMANDKERCGVAFGDITRKVGLVKKSHGDISVYKDKYSKVNFFDNIIREGIVSKNDFVNPVNSKNCYDGAYIHFYKDDDFVYYYKIVLPGCLEYNTNIIHNFPVGFTPSAIYADELTSGLINPPHGDDVKPSNGGGNAGLEADDEPIDEYEENIGGNGGGNPGGKTKNTGTETGGKVDDGSTLEESGGSASEEETVTSDGKETGSIGKIQ